MKDSNNKVKIAIKNAKRQFFDRLNTDLKRNPKQFWKYVKKTRKDDISIQSLSVDGITVQDNAEMAEAFNAFFQSVFFPRKRQLLLYRDLSVM